MKIDIVCKGDTSIHIDDFRELQGDLKTRTESDYERLKASLIKFGFRIPMYYVRLDNQNFIMDGHGRVSTIKRMIREGYSFGKDNKIPAVKIEANNRKEAKEVLLAINSNYGTMTTKGLNDFLEEDDIKYEDIDDFFTPHDFDIEDYFKEFEEELNDDDVIEIDKDSVESEDKPEKPEPEIKLNNIVIKYGDVIELGKHRLMCGNSQNESDVAVLMDGNKADMIFTDPPYNLASGLKISSRGIRKKYQELADSDWDKNFHINVFLETIEKFISSNSSIYICTSHFLFGDIVKWMLGFTDYSNYCVWRKTNPMISMHKRHWNWATELLCYGTKGKHIFNYPDECAEATSVWTISKSSNNKYHPTQKPVQLPQYAILHSSLEGHIVADFFGGSGPTLLACELNNRICYTMELEPKFVQTIIERFCIETNTEEIKINGVKVKWNEYKEV